MADTKTTKMNLGSVLANGAVGALADAGGSILSAGLGSLLSALPGHTILGSLGRSMTGSGLTGAQIEANQFSHNEAELAFQRELSADSTKYQRMVADANKAGLNPVFLAGSGAGSVSSPAASSVSPSAPNLTALFESIMAQKQFDLQERLTNAQIGKLNAETDKTNVEITGQTISNEIAQATKDAKIESERLTNDLTRAKVFEVNSMLDKIAADIKKTAEETKTEEQRRSLFAAQRILATANARQIVEMLPYNKMLAEAKTESDRQAALLSAAHTAYQNHLIDDGYLDAFIRSATAAADKTEAEAAVSQMRAAIRTGDYSKTGEFVTDSIARDFFQDLTLLLDNINPLNNLFK